MSSLFHAVGELDRFADALERLLKCLRVVVLRERQVVEQIVSESASLVMYCPAPLTDLGGALAPELDVLLWR